MQNYKKAAAAVIAVTVCSLSFAADKEIYVQAGSSKARQPGSAGNWRQPSDLPYGFDLRSDTQSVGFIYRNFGISYSNLGTFAVSGKYVEDRFYDPKHGRVKKCATVYDISANQHTTATSIFYSPDLVRNNFSFRPKIGIAQIHQNEWSNSGGEWRSKDSDRITPVIGAGIDYKIGSVAVGIGFEWFIHPRYRDSVVDRIRTQVLEIRYSF